MLYILSLVNVNESFTKQLTSGFRFFIIRSGLIKDKIDFGGLIMTNREIAKKLNISPAAFSLIINHKPGVSEETRKNVLNELRETGYGHLIKTIPAVVSNNLSFIIYKRHGKVLDIHPFFLLLMENIEAHAKKYGYNILLCTVDKRRPMEEQIRHLCEQGSRGAIIFATEMQPEDMEPFFKLPFPVVALDNDFTTLSCNAISINNQMGTYQAVEHLTERGVSRIGYLKGKIRISSFRERERGYEDALEHFQKKFLPKDVIELDYSEEGSYRDMCRYLKENSNLPEGFVCDDDTIAVGAMRALGEAGYKVPEDISVVGFNDRPACEVTVPPLTSVNVSKHVFSAEAVDELIRLIENEKQELPKMRSRKIRIGTRLVKRGSVRCNPQISEKN